MLFKIVIEIFEQNIRKKLKTQINCIYLISNNDKEKLFSIALWLNSFKSHTNKSRFQNYIKISQTM